MKRITYILLLILNSYLLPFCSAQSRIINTIAGGGSSGLGDNGQATDASLDGPIGIVIDKNGNIYVSDNFHSRIRKVDFSTGVITTYGGTGNGGSNGDGGLATAADIGSPSGIAFDTAYNLYIADDVDNVVRKINYHTGIITTVAGNGYYSSGEGWYYGDGGPATAAELNNPEAVAIDRTGNIFIADYFNNRIRKVDTTTGIITTVVGNGYGMWVGPGSWTGTYAGDGGQAIAAELYGPTLIIVDDSDNMIISDSYNAAIRKVSVSTGIIMTIVGNGHWGYTGDGGLATSAELFFPNGVVMDSLGNMYIADAGNNVIRLVTKTTGIITTIAGNGYRAGTGGWGFSGDGSPATAAEIGSPQFVAINDSGSYYITDLGNNRIRKVTDTNTVTGNKLIAKSEELRVFPNPGSGVFTFQLSVVGMQHVVSLEVYNVLGEQVYFQSNINNSIFNIDLSPQPSGVYLYRVIEKNGSLLGDGKVVIEK